MSKKKQSKHQYPSHFKNRPEAVLTYNDQKPHAYISSQWNKLDQEFNELKKIYNSWNFYRGNYKPAYEIDVIRKYVQYYHELTEFDQFKSSSKGINTIKRENLSNAPSEEVLFKSFIIFNDTPWKIRFTNKFVQRLSELQQNGAKKVLATAIYLAQGNLPGPNFSQTFLRVKPLNYTNSFYYTSFFSIRIAINKNIVFSVGVQRVPVMDRNERITRYEFKSYINFIDIINDQRMVYDVNDILNQYYSKLVDDVARGPEVVDDLVPVVMKKQNNENYLFSLEQIGMNGECIVVRNQLNSYMVVRYRPVEFEPVYLSNAESSSLVFDPELNRWLNSDVKMRIERKKFNLFQQAVNKEILKKYVDFQSAKSLVDLLQKIPNFRITLTEEEKNVIGENGNVMVIGRSGTGKTTCAVMRLFAIEMLFKIRVGLNKKKFESILKDTRFGADDLDVALGLHSLFVTASPVLTNEIQRYYKKLTDQIKDELNKKKQRDLEKKKAQEEEERLRRMEESVEESVEIVDRSEIVEEIKEEKVEEITEEIPEVRKEMSVEEIQQIEEEQHITQHFEGITLEEKKEEEEGEDSEEFDEEFQQFNEKINKFGSLNDLNEQDYPGFFTVRALIMMIDGTLKKPFFLRNSGNKIMGKESKAAWHNEEKGVMMIENYFKKMQVEGQEEQPQEEEINEEFVYSDEEELQHEYQRQLRLREQRNIQQFKGKIQGARLNNQMSFEVDFDYFAMHFWPHIKKRYYTDKNISAHMIWTEIYSTIKGGATSHFYPGGYLPEKIYIEKCQNMFLTNDQKKEIYESFCQYERWKAKMMAYDLIDVVNYINIQLRWSGYYGPSIHYLMIDEVQDLPHCILYLLSRVAEQGVFFSGDTAQTIAKGVGFRFGDLRSMFDRKHFNSELKLEKPSVLQLTVNFRSHNNILQLANSVVSVIEVLFPKTIDRLKKQKSDLHGPKPMLLADSDEELLFLVLCGEQFYKKQLDNQEGNLAKRPPLEFGCEQVIIVRDQQSKKRIPSILQHALCLTIYEAKGLEFNDVILFNFFAESKCEDRWPILKFIDVVDEEIDKKVYESEITKHSQAMKSEEKKEGDVEDMFGEANLLEAVEKGEKVVIKKIKASSSINVKDINDYGELCSELKLLYTAITRPRNTLIIYDENSAGRKIVEKYWEKIGVTETITKEILEAVKDKKNQNKSEEAKIFQNLITKTDGSEWKKQGLKMFKRNYFEQAMKCFERCGDRELYLKAKANGMANESTKMLIEVESERSYLKDKRDNAVGLSHNDSVAAKNQLKHNQRLALKNFLQAGRIFEELQMWKQAGQCFFSGKDYQKAKNCFSSAGMHKQVGQSFFMMQKYQEAYQYFDETGDYAKTIECLDMINDWSLILKIIDKYSVKIPEGEKQSLVRKYAALCLEELVQSIEFENEGHKEEEMKKDAVQPLVIRERDSDEEDSYDSEEEEEDYESEVSGDRESQKKMSAELSKKASEELESVDESKSRKESGLSEGSEIINQQSKISKVSQVQQVIQTKSEKKEQSKQQPDSSSHDDSSFLKLNNPNDASHSVNSSWIQLNEPDMQSVKSIVDPSDEWLRSAFSEIENKSHTDYSVIDEDENIAKNARIIKTRGNIFIQDSVMERIIEIVSIVNSNIEDYLEKLKGHQALITKKKEGVESVQISDFEEIDPEFVFKILDTLESFKIYKLCVFVCNRYHMPSKLGRYIASMMLRYAVTAQDNMSITPSLLAIGPHRKTLLEKSILSSVALHSILENINPIFLKVKVSDKNHQQSLGSYFVTSLILEGMYKKMIFIVDVEEALAVLYNYFEADIYKNIYMTTYLKDEDQEKFAFYPQLPTEPHTIEFSLVMAEQFIFKKLYKTSGRDNNHPLISAYFSKEHTARALIFKEEFPQYFPYNKALWRYIEKKEGLKQLAGKVAEFNQEVKGLLDETQEFSEIQVYDIITFAITLLNSTELRDTYMQLPYSQAISLHSNFKRLHHFISTLQSQSRYRLQILKAFLSVYQARILSPKSKTMSIFGDSFIFIHRSSSIMSDLIEYRRRKLIQFQEKASKTPTLLLKFREEIFFCEQNLDILIAPLTLVLEQIAKRVIKRILESLDKYSTDLHDEIESITILNEDYLKLEEKYIVIGFCKHEVDKFEQKEAMLKQKHKQYVSVPKPSYVDHLRLTKTAPQISKTLVSLALLDEDDSDDYDREKERSYGFLYENVFNHHPNMHPTLKNYLLEKFNAGTARKMGFSKFLYVSDQTKLFREFCRRMEGFLLYDALEFKNFNRIDLYAINLLDSMDRMTTIDQLYYATNCLVSLIVYHHSLNAKVFKLQVPTSLLKHISGLTFQEYAHPDIQTPNFRLQIQKYQAECIFSADYRGSSDESPKQIENLIKDYMGIIFQKIKDNQIKPNGIVKDLLTFIVLNTPMKSDTYTVVGPLIKAAGVNHRSILGRILNTQYDKIAEVLKSPVEIFEKDGVVVHQVKFRNQSDPETNVRNSEEDYEKYQSILGRRIRATRTIQRVLKKLTKNKAKPTAEQSLASKRRREHQTYQLNWNMIIHNIHPNFQPHLLKRTSQLTQQLLFFYLQNTISSSLDLHFMLMTMMRINELRTILIDFGRNDEIEEIGQEEKIEKIRVQLDSIRNEVFNWQSDEKWLVRNVGLKKKKVFELKWLSKTHEMKVIKKRQGLKKQVMLADKKNVLKFKK